MSWRSVFFIALMVAGLWQGYSNWELRPIHPPDGPIAPADPKQTDSPEEPATTLGRWRLTPKAHYDITARVLSREDYNFDLLSDLIPEDLALGWGPMSDNRVLRAFEISQGARFYSWVAKRDLPVPRQVVIEHSANTHVIPADQSVRRQLKHLRVGQVVHMTGLLVDAVRDDGITIKTSLTRSDSGPGSCEILLVTEVEAW
jgi:hypothetical protein